MPIFVKIAGRWCEVLEFNLMLQRGRVRVLKTGVEKDYLPSEVEASSQEDPRNFCVVAWRLDNYSVPYDVTVFGTFQDLAQAQDHATKLLLATDGFAWDFAQAQEMKEG